MGVIQGVAKKIFQLEYLDNYLGDFLQNMHTYIAAQDKVGKNDRLFFTLPKRFHEKLF